jgi:hypothetical protein
MSKESRRQAAAERLWRERFGEPPPIRTDAELMMRVLRATPPRAATPLREEAVGAGA